MKGSPISFQLESSLKFSFEGDFQMQIEDPSIFSLIVFSNLTLLKEEI
jgi:hypothetical protein